MGFELNMSTDEGPELRELVAQTLENNGVLSKIRAELRASVFLALEEQESFQDKIPFINKSLKEFLKTSQGSLVACLVREFLEFFELDFTLSVFDPETYHGKDYDYCGRNKLISDLKIKNVNERKAPLLSHILQLVFSRFGNEGSSSAAAVDDEFQEQGCEERVGKEAADVILNRTFSKDEEPPLREGGVVETAPGSKAAPAAASPLLLDFPLPNKSTSSAPPGSDSKETKKMVSEKPLGSFLTSLGNLPPLPMTTEKLTPSSSSSKDTGQQQHHGDTLLLDAYDEDFQSSVSGGKNTVATSSSDTEIEEDIGSGVDDLLSNASAAEDLTVDLTASKASGVGDYMEKV